MKENNIIRMPGSLSGLIQPADPDANLVELAAPEHAAEPLKEQSDIEAMIAYYRQKGQWRNYLLFVCGINFGLRASDLLRLRWGDLIDENLRWRPEIVILERKTATTRKRRQNRHIAINQAVRDAAEEYLEYMDARGYVISRDQYMFRSDRAMRDGDNVPIHRNNLEDLLKKAARETGIADRVHVSTHTLRKTFCWWQIKNGTDIKMLQKILEHSSEMQTLTYAGFTADIIKDAYNDLRFETKTA